MNLRKTEYVKTLLGKGFVVLWATAIFWFYLGNLINFHQNRIWGKVLIPACFTHSSVNNKDFETLQSSGNDCVSFSPEFYPQDLNEIDFPLLKGIYSFSSFRQDIFNETTEYEPVVAGFSLRGPPVA